MRRERERKTKEQDEKKIVHTHARLVDGWIWIMKRVNLPMLMPTGQNMSSCTQ